MCLLAHIELRATILALLCFGTKLCPKTLDLYVACVVYFL